VVSAQRRVEKNVAMLDGDTPVARRRPRQDAENYGADSSSPCPSNSVTAVVSWE
jgi:hypothetical protein